MRENWNVLDTAYLVLRDKIVQVEVMTVKNYISIFIKESSVGWNLESDDNLFRTKEEAMQKLKQDEEEWKQEHDSKEKLIELFLDVAEDNYNSYQMRIIKELIPKHFGVDISER